MPFFDTVLCNKSTLHGGALKASATHQSHMWAEIESVAENRLFAIHPKCVCAGQLRCNVVRMPLHSHMPNLTNPYTNFEK